MNSLRNANDVWKTKGDVINCLNPRWQILPDTLLVVLSKGREVTAILVSADQGTEIHFEVFHF